MGAADLQAHLLQDRRHRVAHRRGGGQGQVHDAEGHAQPPAGLAGYELAHAGDLEGRALDGLRHLVKGRVLHLFKGHLHHAGARDAHAHSTVALAGTVERPRHEGIVLHRVAEHHQLRAAQPAVVRRGRGGVFDRLAHQPHGVHVDARPGGAHVDRGAQKVRDGQRLGDGFDQPPVRLRHGLVHQRRVAADEVHTGSLGGVVQRLRHPHGVLDRAGDQRRRGHRDALVHDGHADLPLDVPAHFHQMLGLPGDAVVDVVTQLLFVVRHAVKQRYPHGDRAHVQLLVVDHLQGLEDLRGIDHVHASIPP